MSKYMYLVVALVAAFLIGCNTLAPRVAKMTAKGADFVNAYCDELDESSRMVVRSEVNTILSEKGRSAIFNCGN